MKRTRLKKRGKNTLKKKAWDTFSRWIRNRDGKCVTCNAKTTLQAGHFYHGVLDFDEININAQCARCNEWLHGNLAIYSNYLIAEHGIDEFRKLEDRHYKALAGEKRTDEEYLEIINKYKLSTD